MKKNRVNSTVRLYIANWRNVQCLSILLFTLFFCNKTAAQALQKVTYLYNSGWLIETTNEIILIDYVPADKLQPDSILFKKLNNGSATNKKNFILITHEHDDHFYKPLLNWHKKIKNLTTILGWDYQTSDKSILKIYNRDSLTIGSLKIISHPSTDAGSGFLIIAGSLTFYHAGDHAAWSNEMTENFANEIKFIKNAAKKIDMAFMPVVRGKLGNCKSTASIANGAMLALQIMKPGIVFPMHIQCDDFKPYIEFDKEVTKRFPSIVTKVPLSNNYEFIF